MKFAAAYQLACLGAEQQAAAAVPTKDDVRRILGSVGAEVEEARLDLLFALVDGKDVAELIAAGREKLAYAPSGAASPAGGADGAAAPAAAGAEAKEEEDTKKKEDAKKEEEEEEEDVGLFNLFD